MRHFVKRHPVAALVTLAIAIELAVIPFFFALGLDATISRAVAASGIELRTDLVTITRIALAAPYVWSAAAFSLTQVAAPDLALLVVALVAFGWPGLRAVRQRFRFWSPEVGWRRGLTIWATLVVVFLSMGATTGALASVLLDGAGFTWTVQPLTVGFWAAVVAAMFLDAGGLFEENAWRGFALPLLQVRYTPVVASAVLGVVWCVWHIPVKLPLVLDYGVGGFSLLFAVLLVKFVLLSIIMGYFFNLAGGATLTAVAAHGLSNDSMGIGGVVASEALGDQLAYECLLIAPMAVAALALILWTRGRLGFALPGDHG